MSDPMTSPQSSPSGAPESGRALDAMVAVRVFGWTPCAEAPHPTDNRAIAGVMYCLPGCGNESWAVREVPYYCANITFAWPIVEKMRADGCTFGIDCIGEEYDDRPWKAWFFGAGSNGDTQYTVWESTAPLAICNAALACVAALPSTGAETAE